MFLARFGPLHLPYLTWYPHRAVSVAVRLRWGERWKSAVLEPAGPFFRKAVNTNTRSVFTGPFCLGIWNTFCQTCVSSAPWKVTEKSVSIGLLPVRVSTSPHSPDRLHAHITARWLGRLTWSSNCSHVCTRSLGLLSGSLPSFSSRSLVSLPLQSLLHLLVWRVLVSSLRRLNLSANHPPFSERCTSLHSPSPGLWERSKQPLSREEARDSSPKRPTCFLSMQNPETSQFLHCLSFRFRLFPTALFRPTWPKETLFVHYCSERSCTKR